MPDDSALHDLLAGYSAFITYEPLRTEVSPFAFVRIPGTSRFHTIPPRASLDPLLEAEGAKKFAGGDPVVLFIPGRKFDASGTRHGQGGGWYDRFLAEVPREWLRIGFCYDDQFSPTPLVREAWDQVMDYVIVRNRIGNEITLYSSDA